MARLPRPPKPKPEGPGVISTAIAANLVMLDPPAFLALSRLGWFKPLADDCWRLVDVVQGYIKFLQDRATFASTDELADEFGVSHTTINTLSQQQYLPSPSGTRLHKKWHRLECRKGFSRWQADQMKTKQRGSAEARVRDARAHDLEVKTKIRMRELIPTSDATAALDTVCGIVRTVLGGAPARLSRDITMQRRAETVIDECLGQISNGLVKAADALKTGSDPTTAATALDS